MPRVYDASCPNCGTLVTIPTSETQEMRAADIVRRLQSFIPHEWDFPFNRRYGGEDHAKRILLQVSKIVSGRA